MITQETAAAIWSAYREIATAEKLLADMEKELVWEHDKTAPLLKDAFGKKRNLQLGIPSGENCHRLFDVPPKLAGSVIRAHIAQKRAELAATNKSARLELMGDEETLENQLLESRDSLLQLVKRIHYNEFQIRNLAGALSDAMHRMETISETHPAIALDRDIENCRKWLPSPKAPSCQNDH